ncbi:MAG: bifunctional transaldolase/phosoglucose isomerase [Candidatus Sumerlaeaceae bacterium]|nr:bifunctional transaldolase/phosoglucose isomerase [Candidatus Sumerlaeaceae bacterium]
MKGNPLQQLLECGQSFWMDTISRDMVASGQLKRMIKEDGLRGVTSNPDIFQKAISGSKLYDAQIVKLAKAGKTSAEIYEALAVEDIQKAADVLLPVYKESNRVDGYISLEVSPYLAFDTAGTLEEGRRLWKSVGRPNVFIKVPATPPGIPAIQQLIADGINVNVTLIFSLSAYDKVMEAYIAGLEERHAAGKSVDGPVSVASFFVSRIDVLIDKLLSNRIIAPPNGTKARAQDLLGKAAIASAKVAYDNFKALFTGPRWQRLADAGARVQRPLWASTSTKNPLYDEVMYVAPLIGQDTVNTMPMNTIDAWRKSGVVTANTIEEGLDEAKQVLADLAEVGVDLEAATWQIMEEGVGKFNQPFDKLLSAIAEKRRTVLGLAGLQKESLGKAAKSVQAVLDSLSEAQIGVRLAQRNATLWTADTAVEKLIANRLGWLDAPKGMMNHVADLEKFAGEVRKAGFKDVVLLGMGGSSLCPEVCAKVFGSRKGFPKLTILDTTSPDAIRAVEAKLDLKKTLFIPASKSGSTIETSTLFCYFEAKLLSLGIKAVGDHFVAITDPGSALGKLAKEKKFRRLFENPADIGGRFSALSLFGLVPMALIGIDVKRVLARTVAFSYDGNFHPPVSADDPIRLGATIAALASSGRDKLTFVMSPKLAPLGDWIEQLVAESTGKQGKGVLPVVGEKLLKPAQYGSDRIFVSIALDGDKVDTKGLAALEESGAPVIRIRVQDPSDLGIEFLRWEIATAAMGAVLRENPFDEPNVTESKENTSALLKTFAAKGKLPFPKADFAQKGVSVSLSSAAKKAIGGKGAGDKGNLKKLVESAAAGNYIGLLGFVAANEKSAKGLEALRGALTAKTKLAATTGFGPRYLHSTGQYHKGGPHRGIFLVFTADAAGDLEIPGYDFSFATLQQAQALGDFGSFEAHGCRAALVHLGGDVVAGLKAVAALLGLKL